MGSGCRTCRRRRFSTRCSHWRWSAAGPSGCGSGRTSCRSDAARSCSPKQLAQLDQLTAGRLLLSFVPGLGGPAEAQALGLNGIAKNDALEEALGLVRRWWAGETVDYRSEQLAFSELPAAARPVQDPLEVWLGGRGPKALDRAGRIADGWLGAQLTPAESGTARERIG